MTFSDKQIAALSAKLDASNVKKRSQAGRELSYIEGWVAIAEANRIFGFDGWHRETVELRQLVTVYDNAKGNKVVNYLAKVRVTVGTIVREGCGFGSGIDRDEGQAHESALKEAETDAMKRALMTFGNPFGLALYDKQQADVDHTPKVSDAELDMLTMLGDCQTSAAVADFIKDNAATLDSLPNGGGVRIREKAREKFVTLKPKKEAA